MTRPRPVALVPGMRVLGRLASDAGGNYPPGYFATEIENKRNTCSDLLCGLFGAAMATGTVLKTVRDRPPVALIERPSGTHAVVLVTRVVDRG